MAAVVLTLVVLVGALALRSLTHYARRRRLRRVAMARLGAR